MSRELELIRRIIIEETIFLRHYVGEVLDNKDELNQGRVQVALYELKWDEKATAPWCFPRYIQGVRIPVPGDWVEVYFINGKPERPVWLGIASEVKDQILDSYDGETRDVLHENRVTGDAITYDSKNERYEIGEADESFVKGDTAKQELQKNVDALTQLISDLTAWTPVPNDGGTALKTILSTGFLTKTPANLSDILSDKIKGE